GGATAAGPPTAPLGGGAAGQSGGRVTFDAETLPLAEALAKSGGLLNDRADTRSVFLFRYVPRELLEQAGVEISNPAVADVPAVFTLDLGQADGYFLASSFYMKHKDLLFVSDHPSVDLVKFMAIVRSVTSTARDAVGVISDIKNLNGGTTVTVR